LHLSLETPAPALDKPVANFIDSSWTIVFNDAHEVFVSSNQTCYAIRERHGVSVFDVTWVERGDVGKVSEGILVVQAVTDNELVGNVKGDEVGAVVDLLLTFLQQ